MINSGMYIPRVPSIGTTRSRPAGLGGTSANIADVFMFLGQSNAEALGISGLPPANIQALGPEVQIWDITANAGAGGFVEYIPGTNGNLDAVPAQSTLWGLEAEFARRWVADNPGKTMYIVKRAQNGSKMFADGTLDWNPASSGECYADLVAQWNGAKAALMALGKTPVLRCATIIQGESDSTNVAYYPSYSTLFSAFWAALRTAVSAPSLRVVVCRIHDNAAGLTNETGRRTVRAVHVAFADTDGNANVIDTDTAALSADNLHYSNAGVVQIGGDAYDAYRGTYSFPATPDPFTIADLTLQEFSTVVTSSLVTITGLRAAQSVTVSISGTGEFQVYDTDGTTVLRAWGTADYTSGSLNRKIACRMTTSASALTEQTATLTIGGVSDTWNVTTKSSSFDPLTLAGIEFLFDASDASTLFQEIAGTTPATQNAHTIGKWNNKAPNAKHLTALADNGTRPTLRGVGTFPVVRGDGVDDVLRNATGIGAYAAGSATWCFALKYNGTVGRCIASEGNSISTTPEYNLVYADTATRTTLAPYIRTTGATLWDGTVDVQTLAFNNADVVIILVDSGTTITPYFDGVAGTPVNYPVARTGTLTADMFGLFAQMRGTPNSFAAADIYACMGFNRADLTGTELSNIATWLGAKQGRTI